MNEHQGRSLASRGAGRRLRGEGGFVGGVEALPLGALVFVAGTLLIVNAWAVVDARLMTSTAAREAVRVYVESSGDSNVAWHNAAGTAAEVVTDRGASLERFSIAPLGVSEGPLTRCSRIMFESSYDVPALTLPFVGGFGRSITVRSQATEVVDPFRAGLEGTGCVG